MPIGICLQHPPLSDVSPIEKTGVFTDRTSCSLLFLRSAKERVSKHSFFGARYVPIPAKRGPIWAYRKITIMLFCETVRSWGSGSGKTVNPGS